MDRQKQRAVVPFEFTYDWYRGFLEDLQEAGYEFRTFSEGVADDAVLLRHDVDLSVEKALRMARIEADLGVSSTYCFLLTSALYNPLERKRRDQLRAIKALGHEVALHFSTHEYWDATDSQDDDTIEDRVAEERVILGTIMESPPETVSFHVPPSWVLDRSFDRFRSTYAPAYFSDIDYVSDSRQRWRDQQPAISDPPSTTQILTHPGLWGDDDQDFAERVERSVSDACAHAEQKAGMEFLEEGYSG